MSLPYPSPHSIARSKPDQIMVFGGSRRTLDLLRLATIRSDSVVLFGCQFESAVQRYAAHFAIEIQDMTPETADIRDASAILVAIGDAETENRIVRAARRHGIPVFVAERALVSDFTLIEFFEQRPHTSMAA